MAACKIVKNGERVEVDFFPGASAIKRVVPAGTQIWKLDEGCFVNENGERIELDYSNYESTPDGKLIIESFGEADVGSYEKEPNPTITTQNDDGTISGVPGPVFQICLEQ